LAQNLKGVIIFAWAKIEKPPTPPPSVMFNDPSLKVFFLSNTTVVLSDGSSVGYHSDHRLPSPPESAIISGRDRRGILPQLPFSKSVSPGPQSPCGLRRFLHMNLMTIILPRMGSLCRGESRGHCLRFPFSDYNHPWKIPALVDLENFLTLWLLSLTQ